MSGRGGDGRNAGNYEECHFLVRPSEEELSSRADFLSSGLCRSCVLSTNLKRHKLFSIVPHIEQGVHVLSTIPTALQPYTSARLTSFPCVLLWWYSLCHEKVGQIFFRVEEAID